MRYVLARFTMASICGCLAAAPLFAQEAAPPRDDQMPAPQRAAAHQAVDLPITKAVLYASGVGYFEHSGTVEGNAELTLMFKTDQINDVLKSMVLMDQGGGSVSTVTYPSNDPIERALQSFSVDLSGNPTLPDLLGQLRGAKVTVMAPEAITGNILSVEARDAAVEKPDAIITRYILTLVTPKGLRSINLEDVASIELADPKLQEELSKAMMLLVTSRDTERKPVVIKFDGNGQRQVRIGYVIQTPVWKTSYRFDLTADSENQQGLLQGWAIVENTSDNDWQDVGVSLVSGRPVSFVMDLYTPLYLDRPVVVPELFQSLRPQQYDEGIVASASEAAFAAKAAGESRARMMRDSATANFRGAPAAAPAPIMEMAAGAAGDVALGQSVQSVAAAGDLGELFQYAIAHPVDLPRRRSAMIPIINQAVPAKKVSIYNQHALARHPLNGVYLHNDTGLKLLAGPVTVFADGAYAGDAQIDHMAAGEKRLLSYAVDLAVTVDPSMHSSSEVVAGRIVRGVLHVQRLERYKQDYVIRNKAGEARTLIVEHPFVNGRDLVVPEKPMEKTPQLYRFEVEVPAEETRTFSVQEQRIDGQAIAILTSNISNLQWYINTGKMDKNVQAALETAIARKSELALLERQLQQAQRQLNEITTGQNRLRENIAAVGKDSPLGRRYLETLGKQEDQIEKLQTTMADLEEKIEQKRRELENAINNMNVG